VSGTWGVCPDSGCWGGGGSCATRPGLNRELRLAEARACRKVATSSTAELATSTRVGSPRLLRVVEWLPKERGRAQRVMEKALGIAAVLVFLVVFFVVVARLYGRAAKKRSEAWQAEAARHGFSYLASDLNFAARQNLASIIPVDDSSEFVHVVSGVVQSFGVALAEHSASTDGGSSYRHSVCVLRLPGVSLPQFRVSKRDFTSRLPFGGSKEVTFAEDPPFAREFYVHGDAPAPVKQVLHPMARQALLGYRGGELNLVAGGNRVFLNHEKVLAPDQMRAFIDQVMPLATALAVPR